MTREQIQYEGDRPLPCAAQDAFRCRPDALSDDERTILSAIVLQKGEAEAAEIFRESPEHLRDYTIQIILKQLVRSNLEYIGNGDQLIQLWCFDSALDHAHMVNAVINSGSKLFLRHTGTLTGGFDSFS